MMTEKNGKVTFTVGNKSNYYTQRNNKLIWPGDKFKQSQIKVDWKVMCNVTAMCESLDIAGWKFPVGIYDQPEDNLGKFILDSKEVDEMYLKKLPAMYNSYIRALVGQATQSELKNVYTPLELHDLLSAGTNLWLGSTATEFRTNLNFKKTLWANFVETSMPIVLSTTFGSFGHIVVCTGFSLSKEEYEKAKRYRKTSKVLPSDFKIDSILVDDPWGNCSKSNFMSYPPGGGGEGFRISVPWETIVERVKPCGSEDIKWGHTFKPGVAII